MFYKSATDGRFRNLNLASQIYVQSAPPNYNLTAGTDAIAVFSTQQEADEALEKLMSQVGYVEVESTV